jgi:hypothetical protein
VIASCGVLAFVLSWAPLFSVRVIDSQTHQLRDTFHLGLAAGGWLAAMFGIAFWPIVRVPRRPR